MNQGSSQITLYHRSPQLNDLLRAVKGPASASPGYRIRFNQTEEMFLLFPQEFLVPPFPIHHDYRRSTPTGDYEKKIAGVLEQLLVLSPEIFEGLKYFFNPREALKMNFYQLFAAEGRTFLFLLKLDLFFHPGQGKVLKNATNDLTQEYRTRRLHAECDLIPVRQSLPDANPPHFLPEQSISNTWIGQRGEGYQTQGIWIDQELTKFFSRLLLPTGVRAYPYYPFNCRYKAFCHAPYNLSPAGRRKHLGLFCRIYPFLTPRISLIENAVKQERFSEDLETFQSLKKEVKPPWFEFWKDFKIRAFLNDEDKKEYEIEF
ncbi:MAG: hypothetical protein LBQ61_09390 [Spirochaetales bacterium]|jgi:hypothetical protein|nr:hypothetical protein [Spirochaetales bacterium]